MDLADIIRSRRTALGLSQTELAKAAGVHVRQIARYEAGEQQPALSVAVALADAAPPMVPSAPRAPSTSASTPTAPTPGAAGSA